MPVPPISQLPVAPQVSDTPAVFSNRANTFVAALSTLVTETNATVEEINAAVAGNLVQFDGFKGVWEAGTFDAGDLVFYEPTQSFFISLEDGNDAEPPSGDWIEIVPTPLVRAPVITFPADGAVGVTPIFTIEATPFAPLYSADQREFRQVQIIEEGGTFVSPLIDEEISTDNFFFDADPDKSYQVRMRDKIVDGPFSVFSDVVSFNTANVFVEQPSITSPSNNETDIEETPTITASAFSVFGDTDTHESSRWVITRVSNGSVVFDSGEDTENLTSIEVPEGILEEGETTYTVKVRYKGEVYGFSAFSDEITFTTEDVFFDYTDPANIGVAVNGGFLAGVIDTVAGTINPNDDYQTGERYAVIVSPKSLEQAAPVRWDTAEGSGEAGCFTRWNGLESTETILAKNNDARYEAFGHIRSIRTSDPVPDDGGSDWYLPAMDELELLYRNLKPNTASNSTGSESRNFPGSQTYGVNPSSDPTGAAYTSGDPARTTVTAFQEGNAESIDRIRYWSSTDADEGGRAWNHYFTESGEEGRQTGATKENTDRSVRPVRRIPL